MNILVIDTTTQNLFAAVVKNREIFGFQSFNSRGLHSEKLCGVISEILSKAGLTFSQIDAYAVATGPGSFTGIRIGISVVKGIHFAVPKKLISIDNLQFLCFAENKDAAIIDAGNGWYFAERGEAPNLISYDDPKVKNAARFDPEKDYTKLLCEFAERNFESGEFVDKLTALYIRKSQAEQMQITNKK